MVDVAIVQFRRRITALVPKPRVNLTRFHGILAPHARERSLVTPAGRRGHAGAEADTRTPEQRRQALTWAQRLKRVFAVDISTCEHCGGNVRIVALRTRLSSAASSTSPPAHLPSSCSSPRR
jgi:hypothetical protein